MSKKVEYVTFFLSGLSMLLQEQNTNLIYGSASWKKLYSKYIRNNTHSKLCIDTS